MNKFVKSIALAILVVVCFGVTHQTASARVVLPLDGSCPSGSPIRTQVDSSLVCLSLDEFCPTNNQWFMDYDSPLKCPDYQNNPNWISHVATSTTAPSSSTRSSTSVPGLTTTNTEPDAVEDDGEEEDFAELSISKKNGKFVITVSSSFVDTDMVLRATKKGSKAIVWSITTKATGNYRILTSRALKGFTVSLWVDGEKFDSFRVR